MRLPMNNAEVHRIFLGGHAGMCSITLRVTPIATCIYCSAHHEAKLANNTQAALQRETPGSRMVRGVRPSN
jgi:hypothetical protein